MAVKKEDLNDETQKNPAGNAATQIAKVKTEEPTEQMVPFSKIQEMIDAALAARLKEGGSNLPGNELIAALTKIAENGAENQKQQFKYDPFQYRTPEPEDRLETPKVFWSYGLMYVIGDDKKYGQAIPAPFGPISFLAIASERRQKGKEQQIIIFNKYVCESKKELEFLMNHSLFNIMFFERVADISSTDVRFSMTLTRLLSGLKSVGAHGIFTQAKAAGILETTQDVDKMRFILAQKLAKQTIEAEDQAAKTRIKEGTREAILLGHKV